MGLDLFTGKKYDDITGANRDVLKPDITKEEFLVNKYGTISLFKKT